MIQLLSGKAGTGKTKKMLDMANSDVLNCKGDVVFIDISNKHMFNLHKKIRFINTKDFKFETPNSFYTFLCGVISQNYDIEKIYIDGIYKILEECDIVNLFENLEKMCALYNIQIIASINSELYSNSPQLYKYCMDNERAFA